MEKKNKMPKWAIILIVILCVISVIPFLLFLGFIIFFSIRDENMLNNIDKYLTVNKETSFYNDETKTYVVSGYITNTSDEDFYDIDISYYLYDEDNNIIGYANDYIYELEDGRTWKFSAQYSEEDAKDVVRYELMDIDAIDVDFWD